MKRLLCSLLSVMFVLSAFFYPVHSEELTAENREALESMLIESVKNNTSIEIDQFSLTVEELEDIYKYLLNSGAFPWNAATNFDYMADENNIVTMFRPQTSERNQFNEKLYEEKMAELIAATCPEGMEPWQMVLSVHEYILTHCIYDYGTANNGYSALVDGTTACYGYSRLFLEVMERLDIPCKVVIAEDCGDGTGHAWNVVQLDGHWYHVDLTWDDPMGCPTYGYLRHNQFLMSDSQFRTESSGHTFPWEVDVVCDSEKYSAEPIWSDVESPLVFLDAQTIFLRRNTAETLCIYAVDTQTMEETLLYEEPIPISTLSTGGFICGTFGLSLYEGRLYFTNSHEVLSILPDGTDRRVEYTHDPALDSYVISCDVQNGTLLYTLSDAAGNYTDAELRLSVSPSHNHGYTSQVISPTCTDEGYTLWHCTCGIQYRTDRTPAGHILTEEVITEEGIELLRITCQNCDYTTEEAYTPTPENSDESTSSSATDEIPPTQNSGSGPLLWILLGTGIPAVILAAIFVIRAKGKKH